MVFHFNSAMMPVILRAVISRNKPSLTHLHLFSSYRLTQCVSQTDRASMLKNWFRFRSDLISCFFHVTFGQENPRGWVLWLFSCYIGWAPVLALYTPKIPGLTVQPKKYHGFQAYPPKNTRNFRRRKKND